MTHGRPPRSNPITIYVDADACPVKNEVYRVAARHGIKVIVVSNSPIAVPRDPMIERVVVAAGMDAADDWIAERVSGRCPWRRCARPGTEEEPDPRRHRDHGRHSARQPLREGRRRGDRADRAGLHRGTRSA